MSNFFAMENLEEEGKGKKLQVALVHDFLVNFGGAEETLKTLAEIFPEAPIFTLFADREKIEKEVDWLKKRDIRESFLGKMPNFLKRRKSWLLPLMPTAPETFDLRDFDLVISSSSGFAKSLVVKPKTIHLCYMHSPMRYVWDWSREYLEEKKLKGKSRLLIRLFLNYLRLWDRSSAQRPDFLIANSQYTAQRIKKYYARDSQVIYPPVRINDFSPKRQNEGYFLVVARLSAYKRIDLLVDVFQKLDLPLKIVGEGEQKDCLAKKIQQGKNKKIELLGWVSRQELIKIYQNARAFIFAAEEDFGIALAEALAAGKPVIALRSGGAKEIVQENKNGIFFDFAELELIADGIRRFVEKEKSFDSLAIRQTVEKFAEERFKKEILDLVEKEIGKEKDRLKDGQASE